MEPDPIDPERLSLFEEALKALLATLQPNAASDAARKQVVSDMQQLVTTALPAELHCGVETFGSYRAGLHLPGSDMDFALTGWVSRTAGPIGSPSSGSDDDQDHDHDHDGSQIRSSSNSDLLQPGSFNPTRQQQQQDGLEQRGRWGDPVSQVQQQQQQQQRGHVQGNPKQQQQQQQCSQVLELHEWTQLEQEYLLADLADALEERGLVQRQVERVLHARVPVIKFIHKQTGLSCDFSISRPECAFKAEMQKLLGSFDRRYAQLYRLVKTWAAAHGLNDAASSTLNSWSLGLMVAFHLQCEQPALLPPIWQLLEPSPPSVRVPRILQLPGITSTTLKHTLNLAATSAGAYISRRSRQGAEAWNHKTLAELLLGFFEFFGVQMAKWVSGDAKGCRASTWWGRWVEANWPPGKPYIFSVEDPFKADDNTARSVGTHNILSCITTASYIAWAVRTSAQLMRQALTGAAAAAEDGSSSSSGSVGKGTQQILAAYCWLFGPAAVLDCNQQQQQQQVELPVSLHDSLLHQIPSDLLQEVSRQMASLDNCSAALADSSSIACPNSNNSSANDEDKVQQIRTAVGVFKQLLQCLDAPVQDVCLSDYRIIHRQQQSVIAEQRERERQVMKQRNSEQQRLLPRQQQQGRGAGMLRQQSTPSMQQPHQLWQQQQQYGVSDKWRSKSSGAAPGYDVAAAAAAAAVQGLELVPPPPPSSTAAAAAGRGHGRRQGGSMKGEGLYSSSSSRRERRTNKPPANPAEWFDAGSPPLPPSSAAGAAVGRGGGSRGRGGMQIPLQLQGSLESLHSMPSVGSFGSDSSSSKQSASNPAAAGRQHSSSRVRAHEASSSAPPNVGGLHMARAAMHAAAASAAAADDTMVQGSKRGGRGRGNGRFIAQQQQQQGFEVGS